MAQSLEKTLAELAGLVGEQSGEMSAALLLAQVRAFLDGGGVMIPPGSITSLELADESVVAGKIADNAVGSDELDSNTVSEIKLSGYTQDNLNALRMGKWTYDFANSSGDVDNHVLSGAALPNHAIVFGGLMRVLDGFTGGIGSFAGLQLEAAGDLVVATAVAGAPWSSTGRKPILPAFTATTAVETTTDTRKPTLAVSINPVLSGKMNLFLAYFVTD